MSKTTQDTVASRSDGVDKEGHLKKLRDEQLQLKNDKKRLEMRLTEIANACKADTLRAIRKNRGRDAKITATTEISVQADKERSAVRRELMAVELRLTQIKDRLCNARNGPLKNVQQDWQERDQVQLEILATLQRIESLLRQDGGKGGA